MHVEVSKQYTYKGVHIDVVATKKDEEETVKIQILKSLDITAFPTKVNATVFPHVNAPTTVVECSITDFPEAVDGIILAIDTSLEEEFQQAESKRKLEHELAQKIKTTKFSDEKGPKKVLTDYVNC